MIIYYLLKCYVELKLWFYSWFPKVILKDCITIVANNEEMEYKGHQSQDYQFALNKMPHGKIQVMLSLPDICDFQFVSCFLKLIDTNHIDTDDDEFSLSLYYYYLNGNILNRDLFCFLAKKQYGLNINATTKFEVHIWDHEVKHIVLDPQRQYIRLQKDTYTIENIVT